MNLIAVVDNNWAIGKGGECLVSIPEDRKLFRDETFGKVIVMGRKTLDSLPGGRALEGRANIVLTSKDSIKGEGIILCHSVEEVLEEVSKYNSEDVFIIGGEQVYNEFLPYCDTAHITKVDYDYDADKYFPNLDDDEEWVVNRTSEEKTYFDIIYEFVEYKKSRT